MVAVVPGARFLKELLLFFKSKLRESLVLFSLYTHDMEVKLPEVDGKRPPLVVVEVVGHAILTLSAK